MRITFRLGEQVGGDSLTISTECWLATRKRGSPFSLCPPPTTNGVVPNRSLASWEGTRGGTGGEENTSSGDWRRFCLSWEDCWFGRKKRLGGEAMGAPVRDGKTHRSGLLDVGDECCLKFSKLRTGFSCKARHTSSTVGKTRAWKFGLITVCEGEWWGL